MRRLSLAAAISAFALGAGPALAQPAAAPDPLTSDLRCLAVSLALMGSAQDERGRNAASVGFYYFLGRVDGRAANTDLAARIEGELRFISTNMAAEGQRCGRIIQARGQALTEIGRRMREQGQQDQPAARN